MAGRRSWFSMFEGNHSLNVGDDKPQEKMQLFDHFLAAGVSAPTHAGA
jgi:hypothetical protein